MCYSPISSYLIAVPRLAFSSATDTKRSEQFSNTMPSCDRCGFILCLTDEGEAVDLRTDATHLPQVLTELSPEFNCGRGVKDTLVTIIIVIITSSSYITYCVVAFWLFVCWWEGMKLRLLPAFLQTNPYMSILI